MFSTGKPNKTVYENETFYEEHKDDPTIFVSSAHCNFVCKDLTNPERPANLETCCCIPEDFSTSCKKNSTVSHY